MEPRSKPEKVTLLRRLSNSLQGLRRHKPEGPETPTKSLDHKDDDSDTDSSSLTSNKWSAQAEEFINGPMLRRTPSEVTCPVSSQKSTQSITARDKGKQVASSDYPTPPTSASPRGSFHHSNPFADDSKPDSRSSPTTDDLDQLRLLEILQQDSVVSNRHLSTTLKCQHSQALLGLNLDFTESRRGTLRPGSVRSPTSPTRALGRSNTTRTHRLAPSVSPPSGLATYRTQSVISGQIDLHRSQSTHSTGQGVHRNGSLSKRHPGDMSHRPLDQIKRETRTANRAPHLRKKNMVGPDTIDVLDNIGVGGLYHHEGPYDATLIARNKVKLAPVDAVKLTNEAALRATPYESIQDSLLKHYPLAGTAIIPPGETDMSGRRMSYEEGADLMREPDAPGGAYKQYDHIVSKQELHLADQTLQSGATQHKCTNFVDILVEQDGEEDKNVNDLDCGTFTDKNSQTYHPEDLKGKGEPSFTIERDLKNQKRARASLGDNDGRGIYEMQPTSTHKNGGVMVRQQSHSPSANDAGPSNYGAPMATTNDLDLHQSKTKGKKLAGLKRRFGSLRRNEVDT